MCVLCKTRTAFAFLITGFVFRLISSLAKVAIIAVAIGVAFGGHLVLLTFALANGWTALVSLPCV